MAVGDSVHELAANVELARGELADLVARDDDPSWPEAPLLAQVDTSGWVVFDSWLGLERAREVAERRRRIEEQIRTLEQRGAIDNALKLARRLVDNDALDATGHRCLMWLHFLRDDRRAARSAFDACKAALSVAGKRPGRQTLELLRAIEQAVDVPTPAFAIAPSVIHPPRLIGRHNRPIGNHPDLL